MKNRSIKLTAIAVAMFLSAQGTFADTDVTDFSSLIDAISSEVAQPAIINLKNDITWDASRTKTIKLGDSIKSDITINGGYNTDGTPYTITGSNNLGFDVQPSTNLYLNDIGLKNFVSTGWGGAIYNEGTMRLKNVTFSNNQGNNIGVGGGAIANYGSGLASLTGNMNFIQNSANGINQYGGSLQGQGGAIYNSGTLSIRNNTGEKAVFSYNSANKNGGAIYNTTGANSTGRMTLAGNFEFDSNHADNAGGAIYNNGYMSLVGNYVFKGNTAQTGGAVYNDRGNLVLTGTRAADGSSSFVFSDNKSSFESLDAGIGGGALYVTGTDSSASYLDITGVDFSNNSAWVRGGAIYLEKNVDFNIIDSHFAGNNTFAQNYNGWGGAIGLGKGHIAGYIENSIFDSNYSSDSGGVIAANTALTFVNSKFYNNSARYSGGAISYNPFDEQSISSSSKYLKIIADGADTIFAGNNVKENYEGRPSTASAGQEGLYIGNFLTGFAENDSNIYFNAGNSGSLIFNDIVNATGLSLDDVRSNHKNPNKNIQLNQSGISYGKLDPASNASDISNAPTNGTIVFNNTVRGANLVLHNGTLTFGQKNSYGSYVTPDKYFTDEAKITLKGGTLDLMNGSIESGDKFAPKELNVLNNANLRLDLNLTINNDGTLGGNIDEINSEIKGSDSATLTIDKLSFNDVVIPDSMKDSILGKSVILQFANKNSVNTELEQSLTTVITSNAGYNLELATSGDNNGKNALQITQVVNAGGLPVAVSSGQNKDLTSSRTYIYNATADEEIGNANAWNKGYNVFVKDNGQIIHRQTSNVLKGDVLQINGNGKNIFTTNNAVGIALGVESDGTKQSLIINDVKKVDDSNNLVGWNDFDSAIINNGGTVKLGNSVFSSNKSTATSYIDYVADESGANPITKDANGGAVQNNSGELHIENTSFLNNSAAGYGGAIYNNGTTYINATDEQSVNFEGNTATLGGNDIYNSGSLILSTESAGKITFNGGIGGDSSSLGNIYLGNDTIQNLGSVVLNNTVANQNVFLNSGTLKLGENLSNPVFDNVNLTLNGGLLDARNGKIDTIKVNDLTILGDKQSSYSLDINLGTSNVSDKIVLGGTLTQGNSKLKLGPLNFLNSTQISDSGYYTDFINNSNIMAEIDAANKIVTVDGATYQVDISGNRISITKVGSSGGFAYELIDSDPMKSARTYNVVNDENVTAWIGGNNNMAGSQFYIYGAKNGKIINGTVNKQSLQGINVGYTNDGDPQELDIIDVSSYTGFNSAVINNGGDVVISGTTFEGNNATSTCNNGNGGVIQNNGGNVNIGVNTVFQNNKAENLGGAIYNGKNGTLNFDAALGKNITFTNNTDKTGANDIYSEGAINFEGTGTITFDDGIAGSGTIESYGNLVLNGDNSKYTGTFDSQVDTNGSDKTGNVTVGTAAKFFGGKSNINSGKLNWFTKNDLADSATLVVKSAALVVGNGTDNAQLSIKGNSSVENATSIVVNNNANLSLIGKTMTVGALLGDGQLAADNSNLTFGSNSGITKGFISKNSSNVTIAGTDSAQSDTLLGAILGGTNSGLVLNLNNVTTSKDFTIDSTNITNLNTSGTTTISGAINQGGSFSNSGTLNVEGKFTNTSTTTNSGDMTLNEVALDGGSITNNGTLNLQGAITGTTGELTNSANSTINLNADGSNFTGKLISDGTINVDKSDYLFGGEKLINAGELIINSGAVNYDKISLGSNAKLTHTIDSTDVGTINSDTFKFENGASGAQANFTTTNGVTSNLNLGKIDNGSANNISISNSDVTLTDTDYKGGTIYNLKDSTLNLIETSSAKFNNYEFNNLNTDNVTLDFNVNLNRNDDGNSLTTDTLKTDNSSIFKIGKLYISGEENGQRGEYKTTNNVLQGNAKFVTSPSTIDDDMKEINGATSSWIYKVSLDGDQSIKMEILDYSNNETLNDMNKLEGKRFFQFSENDDRVYEIAKSLDPTATGDFYVDGAKNSSNTLSGGGSKSFFNIAQSDKNTNLNITNIIIEKADKTGNGSVIENNSTNATINITGSTIRNNHATGNGGAIYNGAKKADDNANLKISNTIFEGNGADGKGGAIYNAGDMTIKDSEFKEGTDSAKNDIYMADKSSLGFEGNNIISNAISSESSERTEKELENMPEADRAQITNSGNLTITESGNAYKYLDKYTQNSGTTTVRGDFFGGDSKISAGRLNWFTHEETNNNGQITIKSGAELLIGEDEDAESFLYLKNESMIEDGAKVAINKNSELRLEDKANVTLNNENNSVAWIGSIHQNSSPDTSLTLKNLDGNGLLYSLGGKLNIESGNLYLYGISEKNSIIQEETKVTLADDANLYIYNGARADLFGPEADLSDENTEDTWKGTVYLNNGGVLYAGGFEQNGKLFANGGELQVQDGKLNIGNESYVSEDTRIAINPDSELNITDGGSVCLNSNEDWSKNDYWGGTITLNGGLLELRDYDNRSADMVDGFNAQRGELNILNSQFNMYDNFTVANDVNVKLFKDSTITLKDGSELNLDGEDYWGGKVEVDGGDFIATDLIFDGEDGATWQQLGGSTTFKDSFVELNDENSYIFGGDLNLIDSSMAFGVKSMPIVADNLYMKDSEFSTMNNLLEEHEITSTMNVNGTNHFGIDVAPRAGHLGASDIFITDKITSDSNGTINIADFNFVGLAPIDRQLKFRVFDANSISDNVKFTATNKEIFTPIGYYNIQSAGGGWFTSNMTRYNPQVFRGQVATLASYNNQLVVDDMLLNHVTLDSERLLAQGRNANTYASTLPQFAPYQYKKEDGGLWYKSYVTFENLSLTQGLKVGNNAYGSLVGADFPVMKLKNGWRFMPTAYIGYNGAHQTFNGVGMYQNGGQGGLMGTFMKNDFIGSIVAYGGGYNNEMSVAGYTDKSGNWFAGTAAKLAYNFHPTKYFTIQPTAFMSYNIFGKQHWGTDFGAMSMNSGLMNGINVAPGLNFIYARESWSVYATFQYMYNINDQVGGRAGNVDLASVEMKHGYIQYGLGVTKTWKDRLNSFFQIVFRNGGRTGVGFQLGLNYTFDWKNPFSSKSTTKAKAKSKTIKQQKTSYKTKDSKTVLKSISMK